MRREEPSCALAEGRWVFAALFLVAAGSRGFDDWQWGEWRDWTM